MSNPIAPSPPSLRGVLAPSIPALLAAAIAAAGAGLLSLSAVWCLVRAISGDPAASVLWACSAWIAAAALSAAAAWLAHHAEGRFEARLRRRVATQAMRMPADRLTAYSTDRLRRLVSDDVAALHHLVAHLPSEIATLVLVPAAAIVLLLAVAGPAALLALVPGAVAAAVYLGVIPRLSAQHGAQRAEVMTGITTAVDDYARGIEVFRLSGSAQGALADYAAAAERFTSGMVAWVSRVATPAAIAVALLQAAASLAIAYAVGSSWDVSRLAAVLLLSLSLVAPALRLGHGLDYVSAGRAAASRIDGFLAEPPLPAGDRGAPPGDGVRADQVCVRVGERLVLDGLSFAAPAGSITAITGPSGAGKSTLLRTLAGLQPAATGEILIGGTPVSAFDEESRHHAVQLIPQGGDVLPASVGDNLRLTAPGADDERLGAALARAGIAVRLGEEAERLSGGERQRLSMARAFLGPAPVVLLDEPTSALDRGAADRLWEQLEALAHDDGRAVVVVTHDPALAARADRRVAVEPAGDGAVR